MAAGDRCPVLDRSGQVLVNAERQSQLLLWWLGVTFIVIHGTVAEMRAGADIGEMVEEAEPLLLDIPIRVPLGRAGAVPGAVTSAAPAPPPVR